VNASDRLTSLVDSHGAAVHRYLRRRLTTSADPYQDADDLTAEVFIVAWRRGVPREAELPWLYAVARRVLANHRRRVVDLPLGDLSDPDGADVADDPADLVTEDLALTAAWRRLSPRDREVLRLVAWEGLSGAELAIALGIGPGGAGAAVSRARARLATEIAAQDSPTSA
jgi:RNA polymerase sigma-70 factor (ECF subfamily)